MTPTHTYKRLQVPEPTVGASTVGEEGKGLNDLNDDQAGMNIFAKAIRLSQEIISCFREESRLLLD